MNFWKRLWRSFRKSGFFNALFIIVIRGNVSTVGFPVVTQYFFIFNCCRLSYRKNLVSVSKSISICAIMSQFWLSNFNSFRSNWSNFNGSSLSSTVSAWVSKKIPAHWKQFWMVSLVTLSYVYTRNFIASKMLILGTSPLASL